MQIVEVTFLHKSTGVTPTSVLCRPQVAELKTDASEDAAGRPGMGGFRLGRPSLEGDSGDGCPHATAL